MSRAYDEMLAALQRAPFDPPAWAEATAAAAAWCGARVGNIIAVDGRNQLTMNWLSNVPDDLAAELARRVGDPAHNPRVRAALTRPLLTPFTDDDILAPGERDRHSLYDTFDRGGTGFASTVVLHRQQGFFSGAAFGSPHHGRNGCPHHHDRIARCAELIREALRIQIALEHRGAETLAGGLEATGRAAFLCRDGGRVLRATPQGEALLREGDRLRLRDGRLRCAGLRHDERLDAAVAIVQSGEAVCRTLVVTDQEGGRPLMLDVAPVRPSPYSLGFSPSIMVIARGGAGRTRSGASAVAAAYGLTAAEAEVAAAVAEGRTPEDIAAARQVSVETVRSQVRTIYAKTGVSRGIELARLIEGLPH